MTNVSGSPSSSTSFHDAWLRVANGMTPSEFKSNLESWTALLLRLRQRCSRERITRNSRIKLSKQEIDTVWYLACRGTVTLVRKNSFGGSWRVTEILKRVNMAEAYIEERIAQMVANDLSE